MTLRSEEHIHLPYPSRYTPQECSLIRTLWKLFNRITGGTLPKSCEDPQ